MRPMPRGAALNAYRDTALCWPPSLRSDWRRSWTSPLFSARGRLRTSTLRRRINLRDCAASTQEFTHGFAPERSRQLGSLFVSIDRRSNRHTYAKLGGCGLVWIDADTHREALNNLCEIAGGIVWCHGRVANTTGWAQAFDLSLQRFIWQSINLHHNRLACMHMRQLGFPEVCSYIDSIKWNDRQQRLSSINKTPNTYRLLPNRAIDGGCDLSVGKFQFRGFLSGVGLGKSCFCLLKVSPQNIHLLPRG